MYLDHWQLDQKPFEPNANGDAYFASESHQGAQLKLRYAIENGRGAALVAGPSGVGKTLLVQRLVSQLPATSRPVAQIVYPQMPSRELLAYLASRIAPPESPSTLTPTVDQSWLRLETLLAESAERGERPVIVIDEAHLLEDVGTLETIRLLLNLQHDGVPLATVLLVGQCPLLSTLARTPGSRSGSTSWPSSNRCRPTRPTSSFPIGSESRARREIFTPDAIDTIHQLAHGIPRH